MFKKALGIIALIFGLTFILPFIPGKATGIAIPVDEGIPIGELIAVMGLMEGNTYDFSTTDFETVDDFFDFLYQEFLTGNLSMPYSMIRMLEAVMSQAIANDQDWFKFQFSIQDSDLINFALPGFDAIYNMTASADGHQVSDYKNIASSNDNIDILNFSGTGSTAISSSNIMSQLKAVNSSYNGFLVLGWYYGHNGYAIYPFTSSDVDIQSNEGNPLIASGLPGSFSNNTYVINSSNNQLVLRTGTQRNFPFIPGSNTYRSYYSTDYPLITYIFCENSVTLTLDGNRIYCDSGANPLLNVIPPQFLDILGFTDSVIGYKTDDAVLDLGTAINIIEDAFDNARELTVDDFLDQIQEADGILDPGDVDDDTRAPAPPIPVLIKARNIPLDEPIGDTRPIESTLNLPALNTPENNHAFDGVTILSELIDATQKSAPEPLMVAFWSLVSILFILAIIEIAHK